MKGFLKIMVGFVIGIIVIMAIGFIYLINSAGNGFVHGDPPRSGDTTNLPEPRQEYHPVSLHMNYKEYQFEPLIDSFLKSNNSYNVPDSVKVPVPMECGCICGDFSKKIYFANSPREIYQLTFNFEGDSAVVDVLFWYKNGGWKCSKTTYLDSLQKQRIKNRVMAEVIDKL